MPCPASSCSIDFEAKPLSEISRMPSRRATRSASTSSIAARTSRSSIFGLASAHRIGMPAGVHTRYRRRPQKNREWEAR